MRRSTLQATLIVTAALICIALFTAARPAATPPISLDPSNPHYFLYRGHTVALITSGEHYGSVFNSDFDFEKYLLTIDLDGLNFTRIFGGSYVEVPGKSFGIQRNDLAPRPENSSPPGPAVLPPVTPAAATNSISPSGTRNISRAIATFSPKPPSAASSSKLRSSPRTTTSPSGTSARSIPPTTPTQPRPSTGKNSTPSTTATSSPRKKPTPASSSAKPRPTTT